MLWAFLHLQLANLVVAVWYEILANLSEGVGEPGVGLRRGGEGCDLHVKVIAQVVVLRVLQQCRQ